MDLGKIQVNTLRPQNFSITFDRIPNVIYHCRQIPLPNMSMSNIPLGTGGDVRYNVPSSMVEFTPFALMFVVDEDLTNYNQIVDWMLELHNNDFDYEEHTSDASILLYNNSNKFNKEYVYQACWPQDISEIVFGTNDDTSELVCTVMFGYDKFLRVK